MQGSQAKVALITGVSSGIGQTTAELLARRGWRTFGTMRKPAVAPPGVEVVTLDVRDEALVEAGVKAVLGAAGRIDALVNNAGTALYGAAEETSVSEAEALFDTNLFGVMRMTRAVLPTMRTQRSGRIVTIGSVAGFVPIPFEAAYSAAKHALEGWMESLAYEVERFGIQAILVEPAFIRTNIDQNVARAQAAIPAYADDRRRAEAGLARSIAQGEEPSVVAETVWEAITSPRPQLRYLAGRQARRVRALRTFMPASLFARGLRRSLS